MTTNEATSELRDFKGVWIPRDVWLDDRLSAVEKVLFTEIDSLSGSGYGCYKSNKALSEFCMCSERTVSRAVAHLADIGLIEVESFDGRRRVLRSSLDKMARLLRQNGEAASPNCLGLYIDSNTLSNTGSNDICAKSAEPRKRKPRKSKPFVPPTLKDVEAYVSEKGYHFNSKAFIDYYEANDWHFNSGKPVKNWKQCCATWENTWKESHPNFREKAQTDFSDVLDGWEVEHRSGSHVA